MTILNFFFLQVQTWKLPIQIWDNLSWFEAGFSFSQAHRSHPRWLAASPWSDGGARRRWRGFEVVILRATSLEALWRRSTLLGAPRNALELKEVRGDGGVTRAATNVKIAMVRAAHSKLPDNANAGPEADEGRRSSSLTENTSSNARLVGNGRIRWGRMKKKGFREVKEREDKEERENPKNF